MSQFYLLSLAAIEAACGGREQIKKKNRAQSGLTGCVQTRTGCIIASESEQRWQSRRRRRRPINKSPSHTHTRLRPHTTMLGIVSAAAFAEDKSFGYTYGENGSLLFKQLCFWPLISWKKAQTTTREWRKLKHKGAHSLLWEAADSALCTFLLMYASALGYMLLSVHTQF